MALGKSLIVELRHILKEEYGVDVSDVEAAEIGENFIRYFDHLIKIVHRAEHEAPPIEGSASPPNLKEP